MSLKYFPIKVVDATPENTKDFGTWIGSEIKTETKIPFFKDSVQEGKNFDWEYHGKATFRCARLFPRKNFHLDFIERHLRMKQVFLTLDGPLVLVLGKPTPNSKTPDPKEIYGFKFPQGGGIMLHFGTWHDFPLAWDRPVTALTMNSAEVVIALEEMEKAGEMDQGDVFKISVAKRMGLDFEVVGMPLVNQFKSL